MENAVSAVALTDEYRGEGLDTDWSDHGRRSAYIANFSEGVGSRGSFRRCASAARRRVSSALDMNTDDIQTLFRYNRWANDRMFSVVERLSSEQFSTPIRSSFPSVEESVLHILSAEWIWLKRWKGTSPHTGVYGGTTAETMRSTLSIGGVDVEHLTTPADLRRFAESIDAERQEFLDKLDDAALHATLHYTDMVGQAYSTPLVQLFQHLVNHGTYHRGQLTTLLRQLGAESTAFDMAFFFHEEARKQQEAG